MPEDSSVTAAPLSRGPIGPGIGRISLPKPLTSFIGRERELAQAARLLGSAGQIRCDLRERRDRFGLSYLVAGDDALPALAEIADGL